MYSNDCGGQITLTMSDSINTTGYNRWIRNPYYTSIENLGKVLKAQIEDTDDVIKVRINPDLYTPRKIIFNDPVSVVFWQDGTKTIVRRAKGEKFNKYTAFTAALAKKIFGNNTRVNAIVNSGIDQKEKDAAKKAKIAKKNS